MDDFVNYENIPENILFWSNESSLKSMTDRINKDLSHWTKVKVKVNQEFIDELHVLITYEWRYRLYVSDLYKMLGFADCVANQFRSYYWEKDLDGNNIGYCLPKE